MQPDGESRGTAGSERDWLSRTLLATRLPSPSKKRRNVESFPRVAPPTRLVRGHAQCLLRRRCRPDPGGFLDTPGHARAVLLSGVAVFPDHSGTDGQRLSA